MIVLEGVQRRYPTRHGNVTVLRDVNFNIQPGEKVGIVGRNGAGKSTMIRLLSGAEKPDAGYVQRGMSVSWPLAFSGGFQGTLTGLDNLRFICRIYGNDWREHVDYVQDFTELGRFLNEPVKSYSSGMRSRLAFALSMVIDFDCFLIDEIMAVGDHRFHERCHVELFEKRAHHAIVFVSHDASFVRSICDRISVLEDGYLHNFGDVDEAYAFYHREPAALVAPNLLLEAPDEKDKLDLATLLFGSAHSVEAGLSGDIGSGLTEWLLGHPLTQDTVVARHRLDKVLEPEESKLIQSALTEELHDDFAGRSLHSMLAALAESRGECPTSQHFLRTFETPLPIDGSDGLWLRMSLEGGSIRRAASFLHAASGRDLPLRLDFHRAKRDDHTQEELAEFRLHDNGVTCRLSLAMPIRHLAALTAAYGFLLPYFANSSLSGHFGLCLGNQGTLDRVLSFCSANSNWLVPDPLFLASAGYAVEREAFGRGQPLEQRVDLAYWRGTDSGNAYYRTLADAPRVIVVQLSVAHPHLIDAKISHVEEQHGWEAREQYYRDNGLFDNTGTISSIIDYRFQIDIEGDDQAWRDFFIKLLTASPVVKLESDMGLQQWYHHKLIPWVHYVPARSDGEDLIERLEWLRENPEQATKIGRAGRELALSITYQEAIDSAMQSISKLIKANSRLSLK